MYKIQNKLSKIMTLLNGSGNGKGRKERGYSTFRTYDMFLIELNYIFMILYIYDSM